MHYISRSGDTPTQAHINYECPCGCTAGLIYDRVSGSTELGQCCCGRLLWVGDKAESVIEFFYEDGVEYQLDVGAVTLPWGEQVQTALAVPASEAAKEGASSIAAKVAAQLERMVNDVVCGMPVDPETTLLRSEFLGSTYYFCSEACKARFDGAPQVFAFGGGR
jgi:YHS domain-containing protein